MVKGISVVIPNFNGIDLLPVTLPTVFEALKNSGKPYELIIADDCSTDDSIKFLQKNFSSVKIITNKVNSGFSVTANKGVFEAAYDKVLLLNSDIQLTPQYFLHQFSYFDNPETFGVMARIIGWNDDEIQDGAKFPAFHGVKIKTAGNYILKDEKMMDNGLYTMYLSGANAFFDKEKFVQLGGFNTLFTPFYSEDFELSLRAWRLGFVCWYDYKSVCRHKVSHTIKSSSKKKFVNTIYERNKMFVHAIHLQGIKRTLWFLQLFPEALIRFVTMRWYYFKSLYLFRDSLEMVNKSRKKFLKSLAGKSNTKNVSEVADFIKSNIKGEIVRF